MRSARWRKPTIARRCAKIWTPADDRAMRAALVVLGADIRAAGGLDAWLDHGIEEWLGPECCPARPRA